LRVKDIDFAQQQILVRDGKILYDRAALRADGQRQDDRLAEAKQVVGKPCLKLFFSAHQRISEAQIA
jgi:hypothetical protein